MAVQILGLRDYKDRKSGKIRKTEKFFEHNWRAPNVPKLFSNLDEYIAKIPEEERYNLYYTAADCFEEKGRKLSTQNIIPIDIDDIDVTRPDDYVNLVCKELDVPIDKVGSVFSGNGIQILIGTTHTITDESFFDRERHLYKAMCGLINTSLYMHGMEGHADTSVFSAGRLLRLPNTMNRKKDKEHRKAYVINPTIELLDFNLADKTGVPKVVEGGYIHPRALSRLPAPDTRAVLEGCDFLKYCRENQQQVSEPQWYAMLSVVGRLENGEQLSHKFSDQHTEYNVDETQFKYQQALDASGPRTCENISSMWEGCSDCANYNICKSPIMLKSEDHIATKDTGFYEMSIDRNGNEKQGKPSYDDLSKYFFQNSPYSTMEQANIVYVFDGKKWVDVTRNRLHNFAEINFDPKPNNNMCVEFEAKLKRTKLKDQEWYQPTGFINFDNGILNLETNEFENHSPELGFKYVLPFDYDPNAGCPRFTKFLEEITMEREDLIKVIIEFMGYSIAGVDPAIGQKALILHGDGANGKSVLIEVLRALAGTDNYSTLSMGAEINRLENRYQLSGKLFNISEETPTGAMVDSSVFKALVSGGEVQARKLYCDSFSMRNFAKIIMACNELPSTSDLSHGMLRRLLIIPFDVKYTRETRDVYLIDKLKSELSGIFNLCMEGRHRFIQQKGFTESATVDKSLSTYVEENDSVLNFLLDNCDFNEPNVESVATLFNSYRYYCDESSMKSLTKVKFSKRITSIISTKLNIADARVNTRLDGKRVRAIRGVKLVEGGGSF